jgi:hypothetical protein
MKILGKISKGKLEIGKYNRKLLNDFLKNPSNENIVISVESRTPESKNVRRFYHGAILPLWAYLNGWDYRKAERIEYLHNHAKMEFNGEIDMLEGKEIKVGMSTKGLLIENDKHNSGYLERIINYLEENYGIDREKVLNPEHYKKWADEVYSVGMCDDYIAYLRELKFLK